jgi:hypothetical protein
VTLTTELAALSFFSVQRPQSVISSKFFEFFLVTPQFCVNVLERFRIPLLPLHQDNDIAAILDDQRGVPLLLRSLTQRFLGLGSDGDEHLGFVEAAWLKSEGVSRDS